MRQHLILVRKELKNMHRELLIFFVLQIGFMMFSLAIRTFPGIHFFKSSSPVERFLVDMFGLSPYLIPAALVYSLYLEEQTGTLYQALSLPVRRMLLPVKFIIALGAMVVLTLLIIGYTYIGYVDIGFGMGYRQATPKALISGIVGFLCYPFISLCLVCTAWGFMRFVRRNRLVVGLVTGIVGYGLYIWLMDYIKTWGILYHDSFDFYSLTYTVVYTLVMGAVFAFIGFFVYERFSEI